MTIVEAAAMGVPSIIASGGKVGACHLLQDDAFISVNMTEITTPSSTTASEESDLSTLKQLGDLLQNEINRRELGMSARKRALEWSELAYGKALLDLATK